MTRSAFRLRIVALSGALFHFAAGLLGLAYLALLSWLEEPEQLQKRINPRDESRRDQGPPV